MLVENGTAVQVGAQGVIQIDGSLDSPLTDDARGRTPAALTEDGFAARHSGRRDLYPHAEHVQQPFRDDGPAVGRLDVVTAPESAEPPQEPAAVQFPPPRSAPPAPVTAPAML